MYRRSTVQMFSHVVVVVVARLLHFEKLCSGNEIHGLRFFFKDCDLELASFMVEYVPVRKNTRFHVSGIWNYTLYSFDFSVFDNLVQSIDSIDR
jgi:hypothetical protein